MEPDPLRATLDEVIRVASDGARLVYRSTVGSLPVPVAYRDTAISEEEFAQELFAHDRSGTYSSFYVYRIDKSRVATVS
jgi:S-adenosylmethionine-diacylglycerol 3-amino-3-carboxypropyl transferase